MPNRNEGGHDATEIQTGGYVNVALWPERSEDSGGPRGVVNIVAIETGCFRIIMQAWRQIGIPHGEPGISGGHHIPESPEIPEKTKTAPDRGNRIEMAQGRI